MMGLFATNSPFDADVEKATRETNTSEQWDVIIDICDKVGASSKNAKDCIRAIMRRMGHTDPHVAIQAITLLDACIKNCGQKFHLEIASREFENEYKRLMSRAPVPIAQKMRISLKKWAENEFKNDPQLGLIPILYQKLKADGLDFADTSGQPVKTQPVIIKDPNVVSSQQEEDDIARAIELSLKEKGEGAKAPSLSYSALYPSMATNNNSGGGGGAAASSSGTMSRSQESRKVRALYDFEAAEENELTFMTGEIIHVLDDSDPNWWKGFNDRGEGLFPSNFVTADLNAEPESTRHDAKSTKGVAFEDEQREDPKLETIEIDEGKIDRLLYLLHEANPEDPSQDTHEMYMLEGQVNQMLPLIDTELERVDRHHAKLTQLSSNLVDAINMYHTLMRDADLQLVNNYHTLPGHGGMPSMPPHMYNPAGPPSSNGMYSSMPPNMYSLPSNYAMSPQHQPPPHMAGHQFPSPQQMANAFHHSQQQQQQQHQQPVSVGQHHPSQMQPHFVPGPMDPSKYLPNSNDIGPHSLPPMTQAPHMQQHIQPIQHPQSPQQHNQFPAPQMQPAPGEQMPPVSHLQQPSLSHPNVPHNNGPNQLYYPSQNQPQPHGSGVSFVPNTVMTAQIQPGAMQQPIPNMPPNAMAPGQLPVHPPNLNASPNHVYQQPQHMAAINQPVTSTILPHVDQRTNIPVYQQQR